MTSRSTRNKVRHHAQQAIDKVEPILQSLYNIDSLASGNSEYINTHLPGIVVLLNEVKNLLSKFRDGL